jgi:hypothetical protein
MTERGRVPGVVDCVSCLDDDSNRERVFWKKLLDGIDGDETGVLARLEGDGNVGRLGLCEGGGGGVEAVGNREREGEPEWSDLVVETGESKGRGES